MSFALRVAAILIGIAAVCAGLALAGFPWLCLTVAGVPVAAWGLLSEADTR